MATLWVNKANGQNSQAINSIYNYTESYSDIYLYARTSPLIKTRDNLSWYKSGELVYLGKRDIGQCVEFIQHLMGYNGFNGNAIEWIKYINSDRPRINSVVVFNNKPLGHLAMIKDIDWNERKMFIIDRNYQNKRYIINERWISFDDQLIEGYIKWGFFSII